MSDRMSTVLSWAVIIGAGALVLFYVFQILRGRRLDSRSAAGALLGAGFLIMELPRQAYPGLPTEALEALSWLATTAIVASFAVEALGRRGSRDNGRLEAPAGEFQPDTATATEHVPGSEKLSCDFPS